MNVWPVSTFFVTSKKISVSKCHCQFLKTANPRILQNNRFEQKMNIENATSQNSLLREMVKVKKLRFQDQETWKDSVQVTRDLLQRSENFREFKAVYEEALNYKLSGDGQKEVHETKSGSVCKVPRIKTHYVDTVNIELPVSLFVTHLLTHNNEIYYFSLIMEVIELYN